jgi:tetratricopeptide (TPR) repeat protein
LELTPPDDPGRPELLVRWAEAAFQAGRPRVAGDALDEVLPLLRVRGNPEAAAQALELRSRVALRLGEDQMVTLAAEAVRLLESEPSGPALVAAYEQLANAHSVSGNYGHAIEAANRGRSLAKTLGLREPARSLGYRGVARVLLGDAGGVADMERALTVLVDSGAGREAAILQNNLALARYPLEGPATSLALYEEAITFSKQRGLGESAALLEANCPLLLVELGRPDEGLARARRAAAAYESSGDMHSLSEVRAVEAATLAAQGQREGAQAAADWLASAARASSATDVIVVTLSSAAAIVVASAPEQARSFLAELEKPAGVRESPYYARQLAAMARAAIAADDRVLAARLTDGLERRYPLDQHALCAARAQLAEHACDHADAATLYAEAAAGWEQFGNVPERAYALLGRGRCLIALGEAGAQEPLEHARAIFASMGYEPALAETEALLEQTAPAPAG